MSRTYEIRLVVNRNDNLYIASWDQADGQRSESFTLVLPLRHQDISDLRWYLEKYYHFPGAGDRARAESIESRFEDWGKALFDALFGTGQNALVYANLMNAANRGDRCLLTIGSTDPDFLSQPWEMMRDSRGRPLTFQEVTIRRQLRGVVGLSQNFEFSLPLRILLIVSRPEDVGFIDPRNSIAPMLDALDVLPAGHLSVDFCDPPTLARLEETISQARRKNQPYHIVHFDGHGTYMPRTGVGALVFERDDVTTHLVPGRQFGDLLVNLEVPLVLLEACRTADLSDKPVFGSVAPALLESGVGSVVAFSHAVHIKAARILVERFYRELAAGMTIGQALEEARAGLRADPARYFHLGPRPKAVDVQDWFIPQLYQIGSDPALIRRPETEAAAPGAEEIERRRAAREEKLHGFPPAPMYRFHGRAMDLLEIERAFRKHPAVVLSGMGGMGKTALAREAAHWWLRTGRFDAAVFCSFEQRAGAEEVVRLTGQALEGEEFSSRPAEEQWKAAVDLFRTRRLLLVWDNFESTLPIYQREGAGGGDSQPASESALSFGPEARGQLLKLYRNLTDGSPTGRLLVTCRPEETGLPGIREMALKGLARPDSLHLLSAVLDVKGISSDRDGYEREEIDDLLKAIDDHPLSIELIAPHLKTLTPEHIRTEFSDLIERFAEMGAYEQRNSSLLASLEFSRNRLSDEARKVLPYLSWFQGGVFEAGFLAFTELDPEKWAALRSELVATALVSVEELKGFSTPYLRFHPTLPYAARPDDVPEPEGAEKRFIAVYLSVMRAADDALLGRQPAAGIALIAREEANLRSAAGRAFCRGERQEGAWIADTLRLYLERSGRLRERDALAQWVRAQMPEGEGLDEASCAAILQHAWSRSTQGHADEAVRTVQGLISRLETEGLADKKDPTSQIALSYNYLGRIYDSAGRPDLALEPLQKAIAMYEELGEPQRGNLAAALGDMANAYSDLARFDEALEAAERALAMVRELGRDRGVAAGLGQIAAILTEQRRYSEADDRYEEALRAARAAGDLELQGAFLQHRGSLQDDIGNQDRAVELYREAITLLQRAGHTSGEMQTCDLLATAERQRGHLDSAEAWYARARELAQQLNDRAQLAAIAQNVGILYQTRAEQTRDPDARAALLRQAVGSVEESLAISLERQDQVAAASSYGQLGVLYRMLGDLDRAEGNSKQALGIYEPLNHPNLHVIYNNLAEIARARGDEKAAAEWEAKRDAKEEELARLARGEDSNVDMAGMLEQVIKAVLALAQAAFMARQSGSPLPPDAAEMMAQLANLPPPFGGIGSFLQAVAEDKEIPPVPPALPEGIRKILEALIKGIG